MLYAIHYTGFTAAGDCDSRYTEFFPERQENTVKIPEIEKAGECTLLFEVGRHT